MLNKLVNNDVIFFFIRTVRVGMITKGERLPRSEIIQVGKRALYYMSSQICFLHIMFFTNKGDQINIYKDA
jgi:hypothetical protein